MRIRNHPNFGLRATGLTNLALVGDVVDATSATNGDNLSASPAEGSVLLENQLGTVTVTGSTFANGLNDDFAIRQTGTAGATVNVTSSTFKNTSSPSGNDGLLMTTAGSGASTLNVQTSTFQANRGDHIQVTGSNSASPTVTINSSVFSGGHPQAVGQGITLNTGASYAGTFTYTITNNVINGAIDNALTLQQGLSLAAGKMIGTVTGNQIGTTGQALSGSAQGSAIDVEASGAGSHKVTIVSNTLRQWFDRGIQMLANDSNGTLNAIVHSNTVVEPGTGGVTPPREGLYANAGAFDPNYNGLTDSAKVCLDAGGTGSLANTLDHGTGASVDIRIRQRFNTQFLFPGYTGSATDDAAVQTYLAGRNVHAGGTAPSVLASHTNASSAYANTTGC
jgi:hypothetical protein